MQRPVLQMVPFAKWSIGMMPGIEVPSHEAGFVSIVRISFFIQCSGVFSKMYLNSQFTNLHVGHFFDAASKSANMNLNCPYCKVVQRNDARIIGQAGKVAGR